MQEATAKASEGVAQAPLPESADEESDGAAPAGTTCAAAASSPASSRPCAPHTSSEAARTPVTNPTLPLSDLFCARHSCCAKRHSLQPTRLKKPVKRA